MPRKSSSSGTETPAAAGDAQSALEALPADFGAADRERYLRYRPLLAAAMPAVAAKVPKAAVAVEFLTGLVDAQLAADASATRRRVAEAILDRAAADPAWRERLLSDPAATLREDPIGGMLATFSAQPTDKLCWCALSGIPVSCAMTCVVST